MCSKFISLRVLLIDLKDNYKNEPCRPADVIRKLIHLRYLGLRGRQLYITSSILNLRRLQTLVVESFIWSFKLSDKTCKWQELKHLILLNLNLPFMVDNLTKLQTLKSVSISYWLEMNTEKLVNLRELCLHHDSIYRIVFPLDSIANLKNLRRLSVTSFDSSFGSLQLLSGCPLLQNLNLVGKMIELPKDIYEIFPNLEIMSLKASELKDGPMPLLGMLPNLIIQEFSLP
ncbi:hypothetical protein ACOSP7_017483 [Xanthoceras sorbifolium]